jgi:hypothetical protein
VGAPPGAPVFGTSSTEASDDLTTGQRVIRNQILTRGAPIAGRGLIAFGAGALAAGTARYSTQRKIKPFESTTRSQIRRDYKVRYGKNWKSHYNKRISTYKQFDDRYGIKHRTDPHAQKRSYVRKANQGRRTTGRLMQIGGGTTITVGRALPVLAYGYVGYDLYRRNASKKEVADTLYQTTWGHSVDDHAKALVDAYTTASIVYAAAKPIFNLGLDVVFA